MPRYVYRGSGRTSTESTTQGWPEMVNLLFLLIVGVQCRQFQVYPVHAAKGAKPSWCLHFPQEGSLERLLEVDFRMRLHKQHLQVFEGCPGTCTEAQEDRASGVGE
jgi:hypothetical protein